MQEELLVVSSVNSFWEDQLDQLNFSLESGEITKEQFKQAMCRIEKEMKPFINWESEM